MNRSIALSMASISLVLALASGGCQENPQRFREFGDTALKNERWAEASENYARYLEIRPGEPEVRTNLGRALLRQGKTTEAVQQLAIVNNEAPTDQALEDYCEALLADKNYDELHRTLRTNAGERGSSKDYLRYGKYALRMGDADAAKQALVTANRLEQGLALAPHLALYDFYMGTGPRADAAKAMKHLRMAYGLNPQDKEVVKRLVASRAILGPTFALPPSGEVE
jgi:tetratricopeptide (TPR) repeat protein